MKTAAAGMMFALPMILSLVWTVPRIAFILAVVLFGQNGNIGNAFLSLAPFLGSVVSFLNSIFSNPFGLLILA
jgi:hypothetical protein